MRDVVCKKGKGERGKMGMKEKRDFLVVRPSFGSLRFLSPFPPFPFFLLTRHFNPSDSNSKGESHCG
jgi:hypothetical protein